MPDTTVASAVGADVVLTALRAVGTTHVVTVPDTHQRTVLAAVDDAPDITVVRLATEDDVLGVCAGLWITGHRPVAIVQHVGLFASVNSLRAFTHDQRVPLAIVAGLFGRDVGLRVEDNPVAGLRLTTPLLDALELRWTLVEGPDDADAIAPALDAAFREACTSIVLLGAPTC